METRTPSMMDARTLPRVAVLSHVPQERKLLSTTT